MDYHYNNGFFDPIDFTHISIPLNYSFTVDFINLAIFIVFLVFTFMMKQYFI